MVAAIGGLEVMMERCFGCPEDYSTTVLPMCQGLENCSNTLARGVGSTHGLHFGWRSSSNE
jgi:hypothetical protein